MIESLYIYGDRELFVIDTEKIGLISLEKLPISFKYRKKNSETVGNLMLPLDRPALVPEEAYEIVENIIRNMNIVLEQLVP